MNIQLEFQFSLSWIQSVGGRDFVRPCVISPGFADVQGAPGYRHDSGSGRVSIALHWYGSFEARNFGPLVLDLRRVGRGR